ncbi:tRNA isopentenyltransferase [Halteromyces radiatus]|uniref:tRNA isopentenyltransferase n=1 Tax=Halteromyces radiatus TaxID=101107 RepID=UPI00221FD082|nr:tRNA isopentenyltransferase [Halteromyces radiatus]KAI8097317.1 tRNA isopentenyltransferase [Halteromyces radiatus]
MQKIATIIGTTGVGKSQLGVELCKALGGQIINADAMQVYRGLDIITNKMPLNERQGIPHHLMDFLDPEEEYKVTEFKRDATQCIDQLTKEHQLPVVVGGTNYYVQSLLYQNSLIKDEQTEDAYSRSPSPEPMPELDALQTTELYSRLQEIDPIMANKWHPSNRRKIIRSLQVYYQIGRKQSDIIKEQQEHHQIHGSQARFKSLVFWLYADPSKLNPRLDDRVGTMIETGLFDEIKQLRKQVLLGQVNIPGQDLEIYQRGLWQAIGYKEFDPYFTALETNSTDQDGLSKIREECTERMKAATRRYAKRQVQWIRNKLLPTVWNSQKSDVMVYLLDAGDLKEWDTNVRQKAIEITKAFQADEELPVPQDLSETAKTMLTRNHIQDTQTRILTWKNHTCPVCKTDKGDQVILYGDIEWEQHRKSRWHRKSIKNKKLEEIKHKHSLEGMVS